MSRFVLDQNGRRAQFGYMPKPSYRSDPNNTNNIIVPAGETYPAYFNLGGSVYKITSDLNCNIGASGLGGLTSTVEANTAYYLYAVLVDGKVYLVGDKKPPTNGPSSYGVWTYVGAFLTTSGSTTVLSSCGGRVDLSGGPENVVTTNTANTELPITIPVTSRLVLLRVRWTSNPTDTNVSFLCYPVSGVTRIVMRSVTTTATTNPYTFFEVAMVTPKTVYAYISAAGNQATTSTMGWQEAPWEFQ